MLREILDKLPPTDKMQLMAAFNGGFSHMVKIDDYWIGVYQPRNRVYLEELGAWCLWRE